MWILVEPDGRVSCMSEYDMSGNSGWVYHDGEVPVNYTDYVYEDGAFVYDPIPMPEPEPEEPELSLAEEVLAILLGGVR